MRPSVIAVSLSMLAACGGLAYVHATRDEPEVTSKAAPPQPAAPADTTTSAAAAASANSAKAETSPAPAPSTSAHSASQNVAPRTIDQLIKDTESSDPSTRAAAIAALANLPKAQALPALKKVLEFGEPEVDRHIALRSLYSLALNDGDSNGQIRDVMRHAIYHSDNDGVTQTAQSLLDDVEAEFTAREQPTATN